jgi:hypothetical protein
MKRILEAARGLFLALAFALGSTCYGGVNSTSAPPADLAGREALVNPLTKIDQSDVVGGDPSAAIHKNFPKLIEQNFARLDSQSTARLLANLSDLEMSHLAQLYVTATEIRDISQSFSTYSRTGQAVSA